MAEGNAVKQEEPEPGDKRPTLDIESLQRKKFKTSELPLTKEQHAAIDGLLVAFKKKGGFDSVRKKVLAAFNESVCLGAYMKSAHGGDLL